MHIPRPPTSGTAEPEGKPFLQLAATMVAERVHGVSVQRDRPPSPSSLRLLEHQASGRRDEAAPD
jgi:hypothetical protein